MRSLVDHMLSIGPANVLVRFGSRGSLDDGLRPVIGLLRVMPAKFNCPVRLLLASLR